MHRLSLGALVAACVLAIGPSAAAKNPHAKPKSEGASPHVTSAKPWCAPEVKELSDHVCYFDGGSEASGRRTLVIYLHGLLVTTPGFQWLQQRAMAIHAERQHFTVLLPTSPREGDTYVWPTSGAAQKAQEASIFEGLRRSRALLEQRLGHGFDEVFVVGFSSGAYYASSLALRGALDVDGYLVLAGGSARVGSAVDASRRAPVFVGVSAKDKQTAGHSRAFATRLASLHWPMRVEERNAGHMVDWTFMAHGIAWLRSRAAAAHRAAADLVPTSAPR